MLTSFTVTASADQSFEFHEVGAPNGSSLRALAEIGVTSGSSRRHDRDGTMSHFEAISNQGRVADFSFQVVRDFQEFLALEDDWNALFERCGRDHQVFQTFNWCWHWCTTFGGFGSDVDGANQFRADLVVLTMRVDGRLVMVWPMERYTTFGVRRLGWLGRPVSQYGDVLLDAVGDTNEMLAAAWSYLLTFGNADVFHFNKVRDDSTIAPFLKSVAAIPTAKDRAPFLDLGKAISEQGVLELGSGKARKNRRRARRRLNEVGDVTFEVLSPGSRACEVAKHALELKRSWIQERGLVSRALSDESTDRFFESVTTGGVRCVGARISKLSVDGRDVAIEIGFPCKGSLAVHVIVYDNEFHRYSCGALALEDSIITCRTDGFDTYDLMAPGDSYKLEWTNGAVGVTDWAVPVSLKGDLWLALYLRFGKRALKRAVGNLPSFARKGISRAMSVIMARV